MSPRQVPPEIRKRIGSGRDPACGGSRLMGAAGMEAALLLGMLAGSSESNWPDALAALGVHRRARWRAFGLPG